MEKLLTLKQAYAAMFHFLEKEYTLTGSDDIGGLIGELSFNVRGDGLPGDPASWEYWLEAVEKALKDK